MDRAARPIVLVTGATGRVGTLLRAVWSQEPPDRFVPVWQHRGTATGLGWLRWDMLDEPCPILPQPPAVIVNLAGVTGSGPGLSRNLALARAAHCAGQRLGCRHVFLASSAAVYGAGPLSGLLDEADALRPASAYGRAKLAMERLLSRANGPGVTCLRIGNIPGAGGLLGGAPVRPGLILDPAPGLPCGPERSWIGPRTLASALADLVGLALNGAQLPPILNIAQDPPLPMAALLDAAHLRWRFGPAREGTIARVALATSRLTETLAAPLPLATPASLVAEWHSLSRAA
jgi:nucleoside-diphosphate-sugar epimerase